MTSDKQEMCETTTEPERTEVAESIDVLCGWLTIETIPKIERVLICGGERNGKDAYRDMQTAWVDSYGNVWADDRQEGAAPILPKYWKLLPTPPMEPNAVLSGKPPSTEL